MFQRFIQVPNPKPKSLGFVLNKYIKYKYKQTLGTKRMNQYKNSGFSVIHSSKKGQRVKKLKERYEDVLNKTDRRRISARQFVDHPAF